MKRVFEFRTGDKIPEGAIYLTTIKQESTTLTDKEGFKVWLVWHYFLVEVDE